MRKIYYRDAIREALDEEMARDPMVMLIGEDVGPNGGTWKENRGLWEKYGDLRLKDSPISESGFVGMCVGMALTGMRPIAKVMFSDFLLVAMDQIANQMAKITYMSGGQKPVPMVLRTTIGLGRASAAQHSQNLTALLAHFPGMKIAIPSDAYTAKGLLKTAIRDNDPVVVIEHRMQYGKEYDMPDDADENLLLPLGKAAVVHPGEDVTVVTCSYMVEKCVAAAKKLDGEGIHAEVIDLRSIKPLDKETIIRSVKKTGRLLLVDEGYTSFGITGEIGFSIMPDVFYDLEAPMQRLCAPDVPVPFSPVLEKLIIPNETTIAEAIRKML
ncbi:MAG: alpha-ketoacid dehydrogenase subunit beta [Oscillospiraceae bacterium]|nr:alpha-ketoacid dehydrogenase subunit beta [Oscillospiraceae bacterium]